jgi:hypothetical protein
MKFLIKYLRFQIINLRNELLKLELLKLELIKFI